MWRATLKSLLARKLRLLLTGLAVVLGVGFMAGTLVLTDTLFKTFDQLFTTAAAKSDVVVRGVSSFSAGPNGPGGGGTDERQPVPAAVLARIRGVSGVKAAEGDVSGYAQFIDPATGKTIANGGAPTIGTAWNPIAGALTMRSGSPPRTSDEVAVDAGTAEKFDLKPGQQIKVVLLGPTRTFTISGTVGFGDANNLGGATLAVFDINTAQEIFDRVGEYDTVDVVAADGVSPTHLRALVQAVLPTGLEAVTATAAAAENADQVKQGLGFLRTALLVFAFVALFVGAFIIFNTFNIIVTQRTRELGLLRALGASRRQVLTSVLVEAFVTGLVAAALGIGVGILLAKGLQALLKGFGIDLPSTAMQILTRTVVVSLLVGTIVTVVASISPARRAARVAPIQALREGESAPSSTPRRRIVVGAAVTVGGVAALLFGLFGGPSNAGLYVGVGAALTFVGVAVLSPLVAKPLAAWIGAPVRRAGISGKLGRENAMRNPRRTASTSAALMIGLGLVTFVAVFAASLKSSASAALDRAVKADFILSTGNFSPFSPDVATQLTKLPELSAVSPLRQGEVRVHGSTSFVGGVDPSAIGRVATVDMQSGTLSSLSTPGTVLIYKDVAKSDHLALGDTVRIEFASTGIQTFTVGGVFTDDSILSDYTISLADYAKNFTNQLDEVVFAKIAPGVSAATARTAIDHVVAQFPNVQVRDQAEFKDQQATAINQFLALVTSLLLLAIVIALFGIVNTLGLSIYERIREIGLLRAVGMSRRQVKRMIRVEAVIIALLGAFLGVVIGILFGWAMQRALAAQGIDRLSVPVGQLIVYMIIAGLAGVVASIWPARRAAKLDVLEAISYE